jgi:hypothetical protein
MKFVVTKTVEQLDLQALHRVRERLVSQRTGIINQIRAFLLERGVAIRQGLRFLRAELPRILATSPDVLSARMVRVIRDLAEDWRRLDERIDQLSSEITVLARQDAGCERLMSVPGTAGMPSTLSILARAHGELGQFDDAWRCIGEAMTALETTKEWWCEAEVNRIAGEVALLSPKRDFAKAQEYFERALAVARQQQAKSWELRASMSHARLWRDQGKTVEARELLAPV